MASTLPSPPSSRSASPVSDSKDNKYEYKLTQQLDELLEQYLELLDRYTTLREELSKTFSAGFFSLAQAQRASTLGAGRRYGEECYDERMKAQRRVVVGAGEAKQYCTFGVAKTVTLEAAKENKTVGNEGTSAKDEEVKKQAGTTATEVNGETVLQEKQQQQKSDSRQDPAYRDPVTWFGILVPSTLRQTQSYFVKAIDKTIPDLVSINSEMNAVEARIWATREQLGILANYEEVKRLIPSLAGLSVVTKQDKLPVKEQMRNLSSRKLASRPGHSGSSLLQLGE